MVLPGDILTAGADGSVRVDVEGVGFVVIPYANGASFPVTVRLDRDPADEKNKKITQLATLIESEGFEMLELRGCAAGSKWLCVVLTDPADEYRPESPGPLTTPVVFFDKTVAFNFTGGTQVAVLDASGNPTYTAHPAPNIRTMGIGGFDVQRFETMVFTLSQLASPSGTTALAPGCAMRNSAATDAPETFQSDEIAPDDAPYCASTISIGRFGPSAGGGNGVHFTGYSVRPLYFCPYVLNGSAGAVAASYRVTLIGVPAL